MRVGVYLVALLVFGALLIIDPVALARLGYACATGGCGASARHVAIGTGSLVLLLFVGTRLLQFRPFPPPAKRRSRKKA